MSRSYRKHVFIKDYNKNSKKIANRKLRKSKIDINLLPQYNDYRKLTETWDIHDFSFINEWRYVKDYICGDTEEERFAYWKTKYKCK